MTTGVFKRHWGAYGNEPDDSDFGRYNPDAPPPQQFGNPVHCAEVSHDGLVYVCDRAQDRIQVFQKDGTFVKEVFVAKTTLGSGSMWDIAFSRDEDQRYLYAADGVNEKVYIIERESLELLTSFRRRSSGRRVLRCAQHRHRFGRQHLPRPRPSRGSGCRSSSSRASAR